MSAKLEAIRSDIETHLSAIEALTYTPRTIDEALAIILAQYDRNVTESAGLAMIHGTLFDTEGVRPFGDGAGFQATEHPGVDAQLLFALMGRDAVERQARALLTQYAAKFPAGVTTQQRKDQMADLKAKLRKLECEEEKLILSLETGDTFIHRRRDADPKIILEVWSAHL